MKMRFLQISANRMLIDDHRIYVNHHCRKTPIWSSGGDNCPNLNNKHIHIVVIGCDGYKSRGNTGHIVSRRSWNRQEYD